MRQYRHGPGSKIGEWTVLRIATLQDIKGLTPQQPGAFRVCQCSCGSAPYVVRASSLTAGHSTRCMPCAGAARRDRYNKARDLDVWEADLRQREQRLEEQKRALTKLAEKLREHQRQ